MAYLVSSGSQVTVLHEVQNIAGIGLVTGQAGNITTSLFDPDGVSSGLTVSIVEVGTTGRYHLLFSPNAAGVWLLEAANPTGTDEVITRYSVTASGVAIVLGEDGDLTTLARVRERFAELSGTTYDAFINSLISEVSNDAAVRCGRVFLQTAYTEYYDGSDRQRLLLRQGPLVSVTSVNLVEYGGTTTRTETLCELEEGDRLEGGLRSENTFSRAWIERLGGKFQWGQRNWKVVYTAGFLTIPEGLVSVATSRVLELFHTRETQGLEDKSEGDDTISPVAPASSHRAWNRALAPWSLQAVA